MNAELQQSATNALDLSVKSATTFTISSGVLTALSWLPQVAGTCASVFGIYVTWKLYKKKMRILELDEQERIKHANGDS